MQNWHENQNSRGGAEAPHFPLLPILDPPEPARDHLPSKASLVPWPSVGMRQPWLRATPALLPMCPWNETVLFTPYISDSDPP